MKLQAFKNLSDQSNAAMDILGEYKNSDYLMLLSGNDAPLDLYSNLSKSFSFNFPKDMCLTDEKWGDKYHSNSNESLIRNTGLLGRVNWVKSNFYPVIENPNLGYEQEATNYNNKLEILFSSYYKNNVAIVGMGLDGHTCGVLPYTIGVGSTNFVVGYESYDQYKHRITITLDCIRNNFDKVILLLNSAHKLFLFNKIFSNETDINKFPVLVYKDIKDFFVLGLDN